MSPEILRKKKTESKQSSVWLKKFLVVFPDWLKNILPLFIQPIRTEMKWVSMHLFSRAQGWLNVFVLRSDCMAHLCASTNLCDWAQIHTSRFFVLVLE